MIGSCAKHVSTQLQTHGGSLVQFLLSVHFEGLVSLLLLFDPHQVVLRTLLQDLLILESESTGSVKHRLRRQKAVPELYWPSWSPPGLPSCSHTSWKGRQRSAPQSWGRQSLDPARQTAAWLTYCRRRFSVVAHPLRKTQKSKYKNIYIYKSVNLVENWHATPVWLGWNSFVIVSGLLATSVMMVTADGRILGLKPVQHNPTRFLNDTVSSVFTEAVR